MGLAEDIEKQINTTLDPIVKRVKGEGPVDVDVMGIIQHLLLPMVIAERDAIVRLAGEVEKLQAARATD